MGILILIAVVVGAFAIFRRHDNDAAEYYDSKRARGTMGNNPVDSADEAAQGCSGTLLVVAAILFLLLIAASAGGMAAMEDGAIIGPGTELSQTRLECGWNFVCRSVPLH